MAADGRYDRLPIAAVTIPDGAGGTREVRYRRRRTLPDPAGMTRLNTHTVSEQDRLDLIADRYLGDPLAFWRVTDANPCLDPDTLIGPPARGTGLIIPVPGA